MTHAPLHPRIARPRAARVSAAVLAGLVAALAALWPQPAAAKSQKKLRYTYEQVWSAAVRFLRVDEGFEIVEKDAEAGYVLFAVAEDGKRFRGSLEIVRIHEDQDRPALRLLVGIEDRPSYMEQGILDRFELKLRTELGPPRQPRPAPKAPPEEPASPEEE